MQCLEFREISEAYLSDQLLVETNIQVFRHLENCAKCRTDFGKRRNFRTKLRSIGREAEEFQIDPFFATRLTANLKAAALERKTWYNFIFAPRGAISALAALLIVFTIGFVLINQFGGGVEFARTDQSLARGLSEIALTAVGDHQNCAINKLRAWNILADTDYDNKAMYQEKVARPLQEFFSQKIEMLHAHDCVYDGVQFAHVILRQGDHIVSVFVDKSEMLPERGIDTGLPSILSEQENGFQVASFQNRNRAVFVISDMSETENLNAARTLSNSLVKNDI